MSAVQLERTATDRKQATTTTRKPAKAVSRSVVTLPRSVTEPVTTPRSSSPGIAMPGIIIRRRVSELPRTKTNVATLVLGRSALCAGAGLVAFLASSLYGQVTVEIARQEGIRASARAGDAEKVQLALQDKLNVLQSAAGIERWAQSRSFVRSEAVARVGKTEKGLAASR